MQHSQPVPHSERSQHPMRLPLTLALLLALTAGCVGISIGSPRNSSAKSPPPPPPPPVIVVESKDAATLAEIDAAAKLEFENTRLQALARLASRPDLTPPLQVHLVNVSYRSLSFDNHRLQVLQAVIQHPAFSDPARQAIVSQLHRLDFDNHRKMILDAIHTRQTGQ